MGFPWGEGENAESAETPAPSEHEETEESLPALVIEDQHLSDEANRQPEKPAPEPEIPEDAACLFHNIKKKVILPPRTCHPIHPASSYRYHQHTIQIRI